MKSNPYFQLIRPANLITSATDIVAGVCLATMLAAVYGYVVPGFVGVLFLLLGSVLLYAGGIAMNDILDLSLDQGERPERPLPSGRISIRSAIRFVNLLLLAGIVLAFFHHYYSGSLAVSIALLSFVYNKWSKHHVFLGPLNMGVLRGLNLLLGLSFIAEALEAHYLVGFIPVIYIFAITMVSRGEVHGSSSQPMVIALGLFIIADTIILAIGLQYDRIWLPMLFTCLHLAFILPPLFRAIRKPIPEHIRKTVKRGVIGIIILDAVWVSMTPYWPIAFILLILLPVSQKLGRYFSVT